MLSGLKFEGGEKKKKDKKDKKKEKKSKKEKKKSKKDKKVESSSSTPREKMNVGDFELTYSISNYVQTLSYT